MEKKAPKKKKPQAPATWLSDEILSSKQGLPHLSEKLAEMIEGRDDAKKKKISYSISPLSQTLIKSISEETGATQGHLVDLAPFLFGAVLEKAMERRKNALEPLEILTRQIKSSLKALSDQAPHLAPFAEAMEKMAAELYAMEEEAVQAQNHQGVSPENFPHLSRIDNGDTKPPYFREIESFLSPESPLGEMFKASTRDDS